MSTVEETTEAPITGEGTARSESTRNYYERETARSLAQAFTCTPDLGQKTLDVLAARSRWIPTNWAS